MQYLHPLARSLRVDGRHVHTKVVSSDEPFGQVALRCAEQDDVGLIADRLSPSMATCPASLAEHF